MTDCEKILAGKANIADFDIDNDFDCEELAELLEAGVIRPRDISLWRAADMVLDEVADYSMFPFENFTPHDQIRHLAFHTITSEEFTKRADLDLYDADEWLELLELLPELADRAPWETLRGEGSPDRWQALLKARPELAKYRK